VLELELYHFTCEHSAPGIVTDGMLYPAAMLRPDSPVADVWWPASLVWLTDRPTPRPAAALGLDPARQILAGCDRTAYRFRVLEPYDAVVWWPTWRRLHRPAGAELLEAADGVRPAHWWVCEGPVPIEPAP
jgi:hypothetical protein